MKQELNLTESEFNDIKDTINDVYDDGCGNPIIPEESRAFYVGNIFIKQSAE
jgi:hypothetical protein